MNTKPSISLPETPPKFSVEAARLLLEEALAEEEKSGEDEAAEIAHKRAMNAYTGASILVPPEVIPPAPPPVPKRH